MSLRRSAAPTGLLVAVLVYVLAMDTVAGPIPPPTAPPEVSVAVEPRAGTVLCAVGAGGLGADPIALPDPSPDPDPDADADEPDEPQEPEDEPGEPEEPADDPDTTQDEPAPEADDDPGVPVATVIMARPGGPGNTPAQLERTDLVEGEFTTSPLPSVFPGGDIRTGAVAAEELAATVVRWRDAAVAVGREWRVEDVEGLPDGTVAGACATSSAGIHLVPGLSTAGGDEARLRLANPHRSPASAAVRFATPGDPEAPLVLQNLSIPPGAVREVIVNDALPEREDLAAVVEVTSGRIAVEGIQVTRAAIGGVDGMTLLSSTTSPAEDWTVPWLADDEDTAPWLWVLNAGERTAAVELTLHTEAGGEVPFGLSEVSVPAGELRRVDMTGTFPDEVTEVAVTARSNGVPIVVSGAAVRAADEPARTGVSVQLGAATDTRWVVSGVGAEDRVEQLRIVNPEGEAAVVDVALFDGVRIREPDDLRGLELAPGTSTTIDLADHLSPGPPWTAFVAVRDGAVVVGRVGSDDGDGPLHLVATAGVPATSWLTSGSTLLPVRRPGLVTQLGTSGPRAPAGVPAGLLERDDEAPVEQRNDEDPAS
jgi:hypothetical protein